MAIAALRGATGRPVTRSPARLPDRCRTRPGRQWTPPADVHDYARELGAAGVATDIAAFNDEQLDVIVDLAGFGTTTAGAIETVKDRGRVVQVGLPRETGTINLNRLTLSSLELVGSQAGTKEDCAAVLKLVAAGKLTSRITAIGFDEIGEGIRKLERGEVVGRLVARFG